MHQLTRSEFHVIFIFTFWAKRAAIDGTMSSTSISHWRACLRWRTHCKCSLWCNRSWHNLLTHPQETLFTLGSHLLGLVMIRDGGSDALCQQSLRACVFAASTVTNLPVQTCSNMHFSRNPPRDSLKALGLKLVKSKYCKYLQITHPNLWFRPSKPQKAWNVRGMLKSRISRWYPCHIHLFLQLQPPNPRENV